MSQTVSRGLVDASHWSGMASAVAGYLEAWLDNRHEARPMPKGQFAAAERFFKYVIHGVAFDHGEQTDRDVPAMAGISNLTIAVEVLAALPAVARAESEVVRGMAEGYLKCLNTIREQGLRDQVDPQVVRSLRDFLRELQRQGNRARRKARAVAESPLR